jgi:hypothetical protein
MSTMTEARRRLEARAIARRLQSSTAPPVVIYGSHGVRVTLVGGPPAIRLEVMPHGRSQWELVQQATFTETGAINAMIDGVHGLVLAANETLQGDDPLPADGVVAVAYGLRLVVTGDFLLRLEALPVGAEAWLLVSKALVDNQGWLGLLAMLSGMKESVRTTLLGILALLDAERAAQDRAPVPPAAPPGPEAVEELISVPAAPGRTRRRKGGSDDDHPAFR